MTREAVFRYRCRRCGCLRDGAHTSPERAAQALAEALNGTGHPLVSLLALCPCHPREADGFPGQGVADLVGYQEREG